MKNATYPNSDLPNMCGSIYPIQGALNSYVSDIIEHLKFWVSGTLLVLINIKNENKPPAQRLFKMEGPKFAQRVTIQQTVKYGALLYIMATMLAMPAGLCSHQHITAALSPSIRSLQLPPFITLLNDMAQTHAAEVRVEEQTQAQAALASNAPPFQSHVLQASQTYEVDVALIRAIIMAESSNNPKAVSHRGAQGLMQLMPRTAKWLGVEDSFNPAHNIDGGVRYFRQLLDRFNGDEKLALAAYNAGSRHVRNYGGVPPFKATHKYIKKVLEYRQYFKKEMALNHNGAITS